MHSHKYQRAIYFLFEVYVMQLCIHVYINEQYITYDPLNYLNIFICVFLMPKFN